MGINDFSTSKIFKKVLNLITQWTKFNAHLINLQTNGLVIVRFHQLIRPDRARITKLKSSVIILRLTILFDTSAYSFSLAFNNPHSLFHKLCNGKMYNFIYYIRILNGKPVEPNTNHLYVKLVDLYLRLRHDLFMYL